MYNLDLMGTNCSHTRAGPKNCSTEKSESPASGGTLAKSQRSANEWNDSQGGIDRSKSSSGEPGVDAGKNASHDSFKNRDGSSVEARGAEHVGPDGSESAGPIFSSLMDGARYSDFQSMASMVR